MVFSRVSKKCNHIMYGNHQALQTSILGIFLLNRLFKKMLLNISNKIIQQNRIQTQQKSKKGIGEINGEAYKTEAPKDQGGREWESKEECEKQQARKTYLDLEVYPVGENEAKPFYPLK